MKVLMTADTVGGVWTHALELARGLAGYGAQVALATMGKSLSVDQRKDLAALQNVTLHESEYKLEWMDDPWGDVDAAGEWLLGIERKFAPDVIHLNGYSHAALAWPVPTLVACHSCVLSWWAAVHGEPAPAKEWLSYQQRVRSGLSAADFVVAPTRAMLSSIMSVYGIASTNMRVIPNGREASAFTTREKETFVFSAGRVWDEAKNISVLERIARNLQWPVFVAGSAAHPQRETRAAEPEHNFHVLGYQSAERLGEWMSRASIYCLPAVYEPFGLSVLEAALSGCALVLGDIASLRENWEGAAVFVNPRSETELTTTINQLIENQSFRQRCARRARLRGLQFSRAKMAASYLRVYEMLMAHQIESSSGQMEAPACAS